MQLTLCQCELKMQNIIFFYSTEKKRTLIQIFKDLGKWKIKIFSVNSYVSILVPSKYWREERNVNQYIIVLSLQLTITKIICEFDLIYLLAIFMP